MTKNVKLRNVTPKRVEIWECDAAKTGEPNLITDATARSYCECEECGIAQLKSLSIDRAMSGQD